MRQSLVIIICLMTPLCFSQTKRDYIYKFAQIAVKEMEQSKIPASITLAQGILESRYGLSDLSTSSNNHFGIKCHKGWTGQKTYHDDDAKDECFRKYTSPYESFRDHSQFLTTRSRYSDLFKLSIYDYKGWARGLRKAGYATNPKYADHLIKLIEEEQLYVFDQMTVHEVQPYLASLQLEMNPNQVYTVEAKPQIKTMPDVDALDKEGQPQIVQIEGGPAGDIEKESLALTRDVFVENDIKAVWTFDGDTPNKMAQLYDIPIDRLSNYNEWDDYINEFKWGMKVYLQPKRNKSRDTDKVKHTVQSGETMYQIAQRYGIKTDKLYKRNKMDVDKREQPRAGESIYLRKRAKKKPQLRRKHDVITEQQIATNKTVDPDIDQKEVDFEQIQATPTKSKITSQLKDQVQNKNVVVVDEKASSDDIWATYPSTQQTKSEQNQPQQTTPKPKSSKTTVLGQEEQQAGRSIIYDPTPQVNREPVKAYEGSGQAQQPIVLNPERSNSYGTSTTTSKATYHKVVKGDTLYGISKKYGVSLAQIKDWNNLTSNTIKIGQRLRVSP